MNNTGNTIASLLMMIVVILLIAGAVYIGYQFLQASACDVQIGGLCIRL